MLSIALDSDCASTSPKLGPVSGAYTIFPETELTQRAIFLDFLLPIWYSSAC